MGEISGTISTASPLPAVNDLNSYIHTGKTVVSDLLPAFILIWLCGAILFNLRVIAGLAYLDRLRSNAKPLPGEWSDLLQQISRRLGISRMIELAESPSVNAPIIIGFIKPVILVPVGMLSGLSLSQIETVFIHELMHVRRQDYVINIIQSFVEAIYFFNPFVWAISGIIKREREHCCDDAVIAIHGNAKDYVTALASLEESRLSRVPISLSLAENKNQLLNRIKRIMERSVKNHPGREKVIPALLLVLGLFCASWISIRTSPHEDHSTRSVEKVVPQDTTKKKMKSAKTKTKKTRESDIAEAEATTKAQLPPALDHQAQSHLPPMPPLPDFDFPDLDLDGLHALGLRNEKYWEEFGEEFEKNFKAKFEAFYLQNHQEIEKLMNETEKRMSGSFSPDWEHRMEEFARKKEEWAREHAAEWERNANDLAIEHDGFIRKKVERLDHIDIPMEKFGENGEEFEERMKALEEKLGAIEEKHKQFEVEIKSELIKDGYLNDGEELENMHWHNGTIEINGKKVKPGDQEKYNKLHKKFFDEVEPME
jgi:beta-lactamase regulating signal transducer with metallopeptidase domain